MINHSSPFILFFTLEARLITHTTDGHIWNNKSNMLFLNVLIQSTSVCHNPFGYRLFCFLLIPPPLMSAHTQSELEIAGLVFPPSEEHICYHFFSNRVKNSFHEARFNIYCSDHEAKVVFPWVLSVHLYVTVFSPVNHLTPTGSNRTRCHI